VSSRRAFIAAVLVACAVVAGCGGGDEDTGANKPPPVADPAKFPATNGKTMADLLNRLGEAGPVLAPSASVLVQGKNRFGFALFERDRAQIAEAEVALYVAPLGGGTAKGPFPARYESLEVKPQFQSRQVASDPDSAKTLYVTDLTFEKPGRYEVLGIARLDERLVAARPITPVITVGRVADDPVPRVGEPAPPIHTPTKEDVGGDVARIDTRIPASSMHEADFADVVGKEPAVLIFASPQLCVSKVCGPVVDIVEQVKSDHEGEAEFIHMEPYRDNTLEKGFYPQLRAWGLPTEPWLFAIDRRGNVAARFEGAFSARELEEALRKATRG
jgi:hypothetical protein